jgi:hypothetical protein
VRRGWACVVLDPRCSGLADMPFPFLDYLLVYN